MARVRVVVSLVGVALVAIVALGCGSDDSSSSETTVAGASQPKNTFPVGAPIRLGEWQFTVSDSSPEDGGYEVEVDVTNLATEAKQLPANFFEFRSVITAGAIPLVRATGLDSALDIGETRDVDLVFATGGDPADPYFLIDGEKFGEPDVAVRLKGAVYEAS
jgi:hypothetical protein